MSVVISTSDCCPKKNLFNIVKNINLEIVYKLTFGIHIHQQAEIYTLIGCCFFSHSELGSTTGSIKSLITVPWKRAISIPRDVE